MPRSSALLSGAVALLLVAGTAPAQSSSGTARSYNHRALNIDATHNVAAYGAVGGELGMGRVGVRLEARAYASGFKPLTGPGSASTRNDVSLLVGLRFNRHRTATR